MTRSSRQSSRAKELMRSVWTADDPRERERCPATIDLEAVIARQEAEDARKSATPSA